MFEVRGQFAGGEAIVTWDAGRISGDPGVERSAQLTAEHWEGTPVGPVCGPYTTTRHLDDPLSAYFILEDVFDRIDGVTGDVPIVPVTPDVLH